MFVPFGEKQIYVEVHGEGEPLVLLNGIMMSTKSWVAFIQALSKHNKLILLDFLDQGQSGKMEESYHVSLQADVIKCVLEALNIEKPHIVGISYGASAAMHFAVKYPENIGRLVLFNCIAHTTPWLRDVGEGWKAARISPLTYYNATIPAVYSAKFYNENYEWIQSRKELLTENVFNNSDFLDAMDRLTDSHSNHDVRGLLGNIKAKTLVVGSADDYLMPLACQKEVYQGIEGAYFVVIEDCGHASMYEKPNVFTTLLQGFINGEDVKI